MDPLATPYPTAGRSRELVAKGLEEPRPQSGRGISPPTALLSLDLGPLAFLCKFSSLAPSVQGVGARLAGLPTGGLGD